MCITPPRQTWLAAQHRKKNHDNSLLCLRLLATNLARACGFNRWIRHRKSLCARPSLAEFMVTERELKKEKTGWVIKHLRQCYYIVLLSYICHIPRDKWSINTGTGFKMGKYIFHFIGPSTEHSLYPTNQAVICQFINVSHLQHHLDDISISYYNWKRLLHYKPRWHAYLKGCSAQKSTSQLQCKHSFTIYIESEGQTNNWKFTFLL